MNKVLKTITIILIGIFILCILIFGLNYLSSKYFFKDINKGNSIDYISIEFDEEIIKITNVDDIAKFKYILENLEYDSEICKGEITHKINYNNEIYYLKEGCREIQKENKQSKITEDELKYLLEIIQKNKHNNIN